MREWVVMLDTPPCPTVTLSDTVVTTLDGTICVELGFGKRGSVTICVRKVTFLYVISCTDLSRGFSSESVPPQPRESSHAFTSSNSFLVSLSDLACFWKYPSLMSPSCFRPSFTSSSSLVYSDPTWRGLVSYAHLVVKKHRRRKSSMAVSAELSKLSPRCSNRQSRKKST